MVYAYDNSIARPALAIYHSHQVIYGGASGSMVGL